MSPQDLHYFCERGRDERLRSAQVATKVAADIHSKVASVYEQLVEIGQGHNPFTSAHQDRGDWADEIPRRAARHLEGQARLRLLDERETEMIASSHERLDASRELLRMRVNRPPPPRLGRETPRRRRGRLFLDQPETELQLARRHVREAERRLAKHRELVARLRVQGHPTELAEAITRNLENALENHLQSVERHLRSITGTALG